MNKKGFTLVELTVTMAISVIVGALVFMVSSTVSNYVKTSEKISDINIELSLFNKNVNEVFEKYQTTEYEISVIENGAKLVFSVNDDDNVLKFENGAIFENDTLLMQCKYISDVTF